MAGKIRIGTGYDAHQLVEGRRLVLGGVAIPFVDAQGRLLEKGLEGWSDADVLTHAIIDALLGAAALGNIGTHFPPGEPQYKDISSLKLLKIVKDRLAEKGWLVDNIDATVIAAQPKLNPFVEQMRQQLSLALVIPADRVSVKASTSNGLGFAGRGEGIAAQAVALLTEEGRA